MIPLNMWSISKQIVCFLAKNWGQGVGKTYGSSNNHGDGGGGGVVDDDVVMTVIRVKVDVDVNEDVWINQSLLDY